MLNSKRANRDRKAVSPDRKAVNPDRKAANPDKKAANPDKKAASPDRAPGKAKRSGLCPAVKRNGWPGHWIDWMRHSISLNACRGKVAVRRETLHRDNPLNPVRKANRDRKVSRASPIKPVNPGDNRANPDRGINPAVSLGKAANREDRVAAVNPVNREVLVARQLNRPLRL